MLILQAPSLTFADLAVYVAVIAAGLLAGIINTLAGNGSAVTLSLLSLLGMDATAANGTNRVGVVVQSWVGYRTFSKEGLVDTQGMWWLVVPAVAGAVLGASLAVNLNAFLMNLALALLMLVLLAVVLANPKRWLSRQTPDAEKLKSPKTIFLMFLTGLHGGFVQAGVGILLLATLVLGAGYGLRRANGMKVLIVLFFSIPALALFVWSGLVNWFWGALLAVGQSMGAWLAATFASRYPNADVWVRSLLIVVMLLAVAKFGGEAYRNWP